MGRAMVAVCCASFRQVPKRIVPDVDDSFDPVPGEQQMRLSDAYHDGYGVQPLPVFDGEGRPVAAMLRPARRPPWSMRSLLPKRSAWRVAQFDTLRLGLLKRVVRVVELNTRVALHLPSACPDRAIIRLVLHRPQRRAC